MEFRSHRLANGLEVVAECNPDAYTAAVGFFVRAGSRDESPALAGVSHFLEHMAFKGTPRRSAEDVNREFDEMGAHYNAFTSEENTVYYASLLPEYLPQAVDLLADIMRPSLRDDDFEMEKKVIVEEIQMYLDQPPYGMDDKLKAICFGDHPVAKSVIGSVETVTALTPQAMLAYHRQRYAPDNMFVAAAGKIDFDQLAADVERYTGAWQPTKPPRDLHPADTHIARLVQHNAQATQQYVLLLRTAPHSSDADRYAAKLLASILGDDSGSRLYWDLVDPGRAESASVGHYEYQGMGMFYTWLSCNPEDVAANVAAVRQVFAQVEHGGVTADELLLAKSKFKSRVVLASERPRSRMFSVGSDWMHRGTYRTTREELQAIESVTLADVARVLVEYPLSQHALVSVGPLEGDFE